jgi:hypothetical protein
MRGAVNGCTLTILNKPLWIAIFNTQKPLSLLESGMSYTVNPSGQGVMVSTL